ncbi:MAG: (Fe-S)-binding protein [Candidatus Bathyarchaeota archaeon]|nr:MAG: (Fe-S)-binding protein [Candidatus Bathyarchaeota archaeon]
MDIQTVVDYLKQIVTTEQILTDQEDRYVYSFEKLFEEKSAAPDIIVTTSSPREARRIYAVAEHEGFTVARRGEISNPQDLRRPFVLIDDIPIPELKSIPTSKSETISILQEIRKSGYRNPQNLASAIKALLSGRRQSQCMECRTCSGYCTIASSFKSVETWSSKGRTVVVRGLQDGTLPISKKIADILYTCTECGLCFAQCFSDLQVDEAIRVARNKIAEEGFAPEVFHTVAENIMRTGDPGAVPVKQRLLWMQGLSSQQLPEEAEVLYWVGCTVANRTPKTAVALLNILNQGKVRFTILNEQEGCCGYVLLATGLWDKAKKVADEVSLKVKRIGVSALVTPCAGCYYTFKKLYPEILGVSLPCEILHSSHLIERLVNNGRLKLKPIGFTVSYHDPCSLGRHSQVFEAPRSVLRAIPRLTLVEMPLNRQSARCCGGGGGLWSFNHEVSMEAASWRLRDLDQLKSDVLATACPLCQMNFRYTAARRGVSLKVCDIAEIVESALG